MPRCQPIAPAALPLMRIRASASYSAARPAIANFSGQCELGHIPEETAHDGFGARPTKTMSGFHCRWPVETRLFSLAKGLTATTISCSFGAAPCRAGRRRWSNLSQLRRKWQTSSDFSPICRAETHCLSSLQRGFRRPSAAASGVSSGRLHWPFRLRSRRNRRGPRRRLAISVGCPRPSS